MSGGLSAVGREVWVSVGGETYRLLKPAPPDPDDAVPGGAGGQGGTLVASMPGTVVRVAVAEGDEVEEGDLLLVLEAMKTEQPMLAPYAGVVRSLPYGEGALVPGGAALVEIEERVDRP